jgi:hypothetical protein
MTLRKKWKTTDRAEGPSGRKRAGTFRDVSLVGGDPDLIDEIDQRCQQEGLKRSEVLKTLDKIRRIRAGDFTGLSDHERDTERRTNELRAEGRLGHLPPELGGPFVD